MSDSLGEISTWLETMPVAIGLFHRAQDERAYQISYANRRLTDLLCRTGEEIAVDLSGDLSNLIVPEDVDRIRLMLYRAYVTGGIYGETARVLIADEEPRTVFIQMSATHDSDGSCLFCLVCSDVGSQITHQKRLDNAYENLFSSTDDAPSGILVLDTVNGERPVALYHSGGFDRLVRGTSDEVERCRLKDIAT